MHTTQINIMYMVDIWLDVLVAELLINRRLIKVGLRDLLLIKEHIISMNYIKAVPNNIEYGM